MSPKAKGHFDVTITPQTPPEVMEDFTVVRVARMTLDKVFRGDFEGAGKGEMLATQTTVEGSAGYVAMERVTGNLAGRAGSFAMQHFGIMDRGAPSLTIAIVPDSGTDELTGIKGTMKIDNANGEHAYELDYELA